MVSTTLAHLLLIGSIGQLLSFSPPYTSFDEVRLTSSQLSVVGSSAGVIAVSIQKRFPYATPKQAKEAWMDYHWRNGCGLPIVILLSEEAHTERTILPTLMKERLEVNFDQIQEDQSRVEISYKVTDAGPLFPGIIPYTHNANVTFEYTNQATVMNWDVSFETTKWYGLYKAITQWTVGTAATTLEECLALPRLLNVRTIINNDIDPFLARKECLEFVWASGGGLPLFPPIPFGQVLNEGGGSARRNLLRIPPLITESIVDTTTSEDRTSFQYRLNRPGWTTFPFLLHTHIGSVSFTSTTQGLAIDWEVEIRPYHIVAPIVEKLVEMTVSTLVRNLRVRLLEPDAVVLIKPPSGNTNLTMGLKEFGKISKPTWLGGVLEYHLSDKRSTMKQTLSLFQPWTWGRSGAGDERDIVQYKWTDGQGIKKDVQSHSI